MRTRSVSIALLLTVPIVLVLVFDPASTFGDVFRRNGIVQQNCIVNNRFELERSIPKN